MPAAVDCAASRSAAYRRRQSERTLLYRTVQAHLATWLALQDDGSADHPPAAGRRRAHLLFGANYPRTRCGKLAVGLRQAATGGCAGKERDRFAYLFV